MNGEVKLIFIMRDPLDRAWSAVNNALRKGQVDGAFTVEKAVARARSSGTNARSAYAKTIASSGGGIPALSASLLLLRRSQGSAGEACDRDRFVSRRNAW